MSFALAIEREHRISVSRTEMFRRQIQAETDLSSLATGGIALGGFGSLSIPGVTDAAEREQLEAFRGWVYSHIRPIAETIAGQEIMIGRKSRKRQGRRTVVTWRKGVPNCPFPTLKLDEAVKSPVTGSLRGAKRRSNLRISSG